MKKYKMYVAISWNIAKKGEAAASLYSVPWYVTPPLQSSWHVICMPVLLAKFLRDSYYELS